MVSFEYKYINNKIHNINAYLFHFFTYLYREYSAPKNNPRKSPFLDSEGWGECKFMRKKSKQENCPNPILSSEESPYRNPASMETAKKVVDSSTQIAESLDMPSLNF